MAFPGAERRAQCSAGDGALSAGIFVDFDALAVEAL
jgi:hypothetical protein